MSEQQTPFQVKHGLEYGLKIMQIEPGTHNSLSMCCKFCLFFFGCKEKVGQKQKDKQCEVLSANFLATKLHPSCERATFNMLGTILFAPWGRKGSILFQRSSIEKHIACIFSWNTGPLCYRNWCWHCWHSSWWNVIWHWRWRCQNLFKCNENFSAMSWWGGKWSSLVWGDCKESTTALLHTWLSCSGAVFPSK